MRGVCVAIYELSKTIQEKSGMVFNVLHKSRTLPRTEEPCEELVRTIQETSHSCTHLSPFASVYFQWRVSDWSNTPRWQYLRVIDQCDHTYFLILSEGNVIMWQDCCDILCFNKLLCCDTLCCDRLCCKILCCDRWCCNILCCVIVCCYILCYDRLCCVRLCFDSSCCNIYWVV